MKKLVGFVLFSLGAVALGGCPIYPDRDSRVCSGSGCYSCPDDYYSSSCTNYYCYDSYDCPTGYTCDSANRCTLAPTAPPSTPGPVCTQPSDCPSGQTCGADSRCHPGDCTSVGCPAAYTCKLSGGKASCEPRTSSSSCKADGDCASKGAGYKCLSGSCVAPGDQCTDATQCAGGSLCVQGACTPACSANKPCPTGYSCDLAKGVCTGNAGPCTSDTQCSAGLKCVSQHCVDKCGAGGTCASGLICVDGGCVPDQKPVFVCDTEGVQDKCQSGSVCLRHSCYLGCDPKATDACKTSDKFNVCKSVDAGAGKTVNVCGSDTNLGSECGPEKACASPLICIDGYCK